MPPHARRVASPPSISTKTAQDSRPVPRLCTGRVESDEACPETPDCSFCWDHSITPVSNPCQNPGCTNHHQYQNAETVKGNCGVVLGTENQNIWHRNRRWNAVLNTFGLELSQQKTAPYRAPSPCEPECLEYLRRPRTRSDKGQRVEADCRGKGMSVPQKLTYIGECRAEDWFALKMGNPFMVEEEIFLGIIYLFRWMESVSGQGRSRK
ncbi:hypothetical protein J6590_029939 [Homalodisca vitripennis]|nr:hypothetical protein J6590_029939 [Homalodisca vitripennis]